MEFNFVLTPSNQQITRVVDALSITRTSQIGLSSYLINKYTLRNYKRAFLYWDESNRVIAIVFTESDAEDAFMLEFSEKYGGGIKSRRFFVSNNLKVEDLAGRYDYKIMPAIELGIPKAGNAFIIRLDDKKKNDK